MAKTIDAINSLLSSVFNDIIKLEEKFLKKTKFNDISIKELRTIDAIGLNRTRTMSYIAKKIDITLGTLTVSINNLEKKGYVKREKSEKDKRIVTINLTEKGKSVFKTHQKFKENIMQQVIISLSQQEKEIFNGALNRFKLILNEEI